MEERLEGDLKAIGECGALGHPENRPQSGPVPGLPEWDYYFHGMGCCLTHRVDGTSIDVDFPEGDARTIDPWFYKHYLASLRDPELVERRVTTPKPYDEAWLVDLQALQDSGLLEDRRLTDLGRSLADALEPVLTRLEEETSPAVSARLAVLLGDYQLATEQLAQGDPDSPDRATLEAAAKEQLAKRTQALRERVADQGNDRPWVALQALAALGGEVARAEALQALRRRPVVQGFASRALELLEHWAKEEDTPAVLEFLRSLRGRDRAAAWLTFRSVLTSMRLRGPGGWTCRERVLLRRSMRRACRLMRSIHSTELGGYGLLLALLDPGSGYQILATYLKSEASHLRRAAVAALATLGTERAQAILVGSLSESDYYRTVAAREALRRFNNPAVWRKATEWEERHERPAPPEGKTVDLGGRERRVYTMDQIDQINAQEFSRWELESFQRDYGDLVERWLGSANQ